MNLFNPLLSWRCGNQRLQIQYAQVKPQRWAVGLNGWFPLAPLTLKFRQGGLLEITLTDGSDVWGLPLPENACPKACKSFFLFFSTLALISLKYTPLQLTDFNKGLVLTGPPFLEGRRSRKLKVPSNLFSLKEQNENSKLLHRSVLFGHLK